ncbi:bifunctional DNA primase/polymerase [Mucilaginibacter sabulilitoris]|uniref:Bifunctional DNA primase/polymerase n=1 Tax=Mucilaginibacter sabulilitoris TaxID=1173583 RepID=A0ABZ0TF76_9SPHI|nr:bifunctional DNA primase/polymerase [Mucilaginibacter sabulilitoris]WPU91830.1 bifunctional DNA primase/polymerase [Mucilaginibacter sabulilitoris]
MGATLSAVWSQVEKLILDGISVIPVRDKDDEASVRLAKTPFGSWKKYQSQRVDKSELWALMEFHNTEAVGIVCGKISGNLEAIDVDVKYKTGIDAILFKDIKAIYPELFVKLRIHKTPSGGWHILYRVADGEIPGNIKLAGREATNEELISSPKNKTYNFIETRGEGGYILAPPSLGYSIQKDADIPVLTWEERCSLITLCETYNEVIKVAPTYKPTKTESEYYTENPWDHFNVNCNPVEFLKEFGWEEFKSNPHFIWFTRPGKNKGVSASWNISKRVFFIFTSSTELDANKGYHPATVLSELKFAGDKRKTYQHLVSNGYGIVKPSIEKAIIKKRSLSGDPIPVNFSPAAKEQFEELKSVIQQDHPYGIFWEHSDDEKISISREGVYQVSNGLGFKTFDGKVVQIIDNVVYHRTERYYYDTLKSYIKEEEADIYEDICNSYESFIQKSGKFTIERLPELDDTTVLCDDMHTAYKCYNNGYLVITANDITFNGYELMDKLVWDHSIQKRNYAYGDGGKYIEYLKLAVTDFPQAKKVLGYLSHEYKDETTGFIIVLTEQCPDPKQGGGSGKNVFCNLLKLTTTYTSKPGAQAKFDEKLFPELERSANFRYK